MNFYPKKKRGQNFLINSNIAKHIVDTLELTPEDIVLEIGAGYGRLTRLLLQTNAQIHSVEIEHELIEYLKEHLGSFSNLYLYESDILKLYIKDITKSAPIKIIGNLPYNISTPILFHLIEQRTLWNKAIIMLQKELVQRLIANRGTKQYSALSIAIQFYCYVERLFDVKPNNFRPRPKVTSSVIQLEVRKEPAVKVSSEKNFFKLIRAGFNQRRKMLRNSLLLTGLNKEQIIDLERISKIELTRRAETLSLEEWAILSEIYNSERVDELVS